jgi:hypothetical protein
MLAYDAMPIDEPCSNIPLAEALRAANGLGKDAGAPGWMEKEVCFIRLGATASNRNPNRRRILHFEFRLMVHFPRSWQIHSSGGLIFSKGSSAGPVRISPVAAKREP